VGGLVVNLIGMRLLASGKDESLNVKGAYLEVWAGRTCWARSA
jgi:cobalt-zinc-cadmium efflux system protein